jgi:sodium-dependent phosphate cotransporter
MARALGRATRRSKLVPPIYIAVVFFILPICLLLISSCFEQKTIGFTVMGSFIVIAIIVFCLRFAFWWKYQDGKNKCLAKLDKRTDMTECKKTLPDDMKALKKNMELANRLKDKILRDHHLRVKDNQSLQLQVQAYTGRGVRVE